MSARLRSPEATDAPSTLPAGNLSADTFGRELALGGLLLTSSFHHLSQAHITPGVATLSAAIFPFTLLVCGCGGGDLTPSAQQQAADAQQGSPNDAGTGDAPIDVVPDGAAPDRDNLPDGPLPDEDAKLFDASHTDAPGPGDAGPLTCSGTGARFITTVIAHHFGAGQDFGQSDFPRPILGPPKGAGCCAGSLDVVSLGNGGSVTVAFDGNAIVDGPGPDFIVFENPFHVGGNDGAVFAELATVLVSENGVDWAAFPCTATAEPYGSCAGWHPVFANADNNDIDPTNPDVAGGDPFDLADIGMKRARYVRIVDRTDIDGASGSFDLDAVAIVHAACP